MRKWPKRPIGRPSYFSEWLAERIYFAAKRGLTDAEIAWSFGLGEATLHRWKHGSAVFKKKLQEAKGEADAVVERALYRRAYGMTLTETTVSTVKVENGVMTKEVLTEREIPPDMGIMKMWLFNRQPDRWRANPLPNQDSFNLSAIKALPEVEQSETAQRVTEAIMKIINEK